MRVKYRDELGPVVSEVTSCFLNENPNNPFHICMVFTLKDETRYELHLNHVTRMEAEAIADELFENGKSDLTSYNVCEDWGDDDE